MLSRIFVSLWGKFSPQETKKFGILSILFFLVIGAYWLLRTQKNAAFDALVGIQYQPRAKILSWVASLGIVLIYAKLLDILGRRNLLITLSAFFALSFLGIAYLLEFSPIGFQNQIASPYRLFGWAIYVLIEWVGSLMPGLFWAFVTSHTQAESAKKGYPLIMAGAQLGSILGSFCSYRTDLFGNSFLFGMGAVMLGMVLPIIYLYIRIVPEEQQHKSATAENKKPKTGVFEGLKIVLTRPYIMGVLAISTIYEVINTIVEFEMNVIARQVYQTKEAFASFHGMYGILLNTLALFFALLGTSFLMRRFGLKFCLLMFPVVTAVLIFGVYYMPILSVIMIAGIGIKGLSYALNNPSKEMMYIPTSQDVKFKAKGWIDQFGGRSSKGIGAAINETFRASVEGLLLYGSLISAGLILLWLAAAAYVGTTFTKLTEENKIID
jgi:AAA family ATP:ADP antiporter